MKKALITGVSGQDGAYLAELLLGKGYEVVGAVREAPGGGLWRLERLGIAGRVRLAAVDVTEFSNLLAVLKDVRPDEVYNLAALSSVGRSFEQPLVTLETTGLGALRLFEAVRFADPKARVFQASSAEMFGAAAASPQTEETPLRPRSPYGVAKAAAHQGAAVFRESYGLFVACGILYNHESPLRGPEFVTRKITRGAARVKAGLDRDLVLGNLDSRRDWGWAPDYVEAMWRTLQRPAPADYVIATGRPRSVRDFAAAAFAAAGMPLEWEGSGAAETGSFKGRVLARVDPAIFRPADPGESAGDASKAARELAWKPSVPFEEIVSRMVGAEEEAPPSAGPLG